MPTNVLMICGSLRKGSFNRALMNALPGRAPAGMTLTEAPSFRSLPYYDADLQASAGFPADVTALANAIRAADGVIIISPEYNWTIPGALKNAIDWVSRTNDQPSRTSRWRSSPRPAARWRRAHAISPAHGADVPQCLRVRYAGNLRRSAHTKFDEKTLELKDEPTKKVIVQQLAAFEKFIGRVKA